MRFPISPRQHRIIAISQRNQIAQQFGIQERHITANHQHSLSGQCVQGCGNPAKRSLIGPAIRNNGNVGDQRRSLRRSNDRYLWCNRAYQPCRAPQQRLSLDEQRRLIASHAPTLPTGKNSAAYLL